MRFIKLNIIILNYLFIISILIVCNISYEDTPSELTGDTHTAAPPLSYILHGKNYRFPAWNCEEQQCHGASLDGNSSVIPSCTGCHDNIWNVFSSNHTRNIRGYYHHRDLNSGNYPVICGSENCHGADLSGNAGYYYRYSCLACHNPIPPSGHTVNKEGVMHNINIGKDPRVYCYMSGCHGASEPGGVCSRCHETLYPAED